MADAQTLQARWIDRAEDLAPLVPDWQALAERVGAEVYMRPAWVQVWWDHFGADRQLACLVLREGEGRLVAVLPFVTERIWAGPVPLRLARLAGTDPHCIVLRLAAEAAFSETALRMAMLHLTGPLGCDAVSFTPLSDLADHLAPLRAIGQGTPGLALHEEGEGAHVVFNLPADFASWTAALSKKRRSQFGRDQRALQDRYGMVATTRRPDGAGFAGFATFHDAQWQAQGRGGHFTDWPGSLAFYRDLADRAAAEPPVWFHELAGPAGPLATQFALLAGPVAHWRLPARTLDPEADRLSIGKVGLIGMIQSLIAAGVIRIEAGRGDYDYKLSYGGESVPVHRLLIYPAAGDGRLRLMLWGSDRLHLLYYRIWFLKLAPRVARLRRPRPLWRRWIRSRV